MQQPNMFELHMAVLQSYSQSVYDGITVIFFVRPFLSMDK